MAFGFCCSSPAHRPCPASLPVRVPTVVGLPVRFLQLRLTATPCGWLRLTPSSPFSTFQLNRYRPCRATRVRRPCLRFSSREPCSRALWDPDPETRRHGLRGEKRRHGHRTPKCSAEKYAENDPVPCSWSRVASLRSRKLGILHCRSVKGLGPWSLGLRRLFQNPREEKDLTPHYCSELW